METSVNRCPVQRLGSLLSNYSTKPILLLGAGASKKSGVPVSSEIVEMATRWAYCRDNGLPEESPTVTRSDWYPWLEQQPWYDREKELSDQYPDVVNHLLRPREDRKRFFMKLIHPTVPPSVGYERLADLLVDEWLDIILTTNFDQLISDVCRTRSQLHHVVEIKTPSDYVNLTVSPADPTVVYLHGSVEHYSDKNLPNEVDHLDSELVRNIVPLLKARPLIVIGYRGAEPSIMRHLLGGAVGDTQRFKHGVFWCQLEQERSLHPLVEEFAQSIGDNFYLVGIKGFDEVMTALAEGVRSLERPPSRRYTRKDSGPLPYDQTVLPDASVDELDWDHITQTLPEYCQRMRITYPNPVSRDWLISHMANLHLVVEDRARLLPTVAGYLLFGRDPSRRFPGCQIRLTYADGSHDILTGNLFRLLSGLSAAFEEFNRPYRLKGAVSETVSPYPTLAAKEVFVNSIVHRDYSLPDPIEVYLQPDHIRIVSPGGLEATVTNKLVQEDETHSLRPLALHERIEQGDRGLKGYRNPVIADLAYGVGMMDKAGSGLADVYRLMVKANGRAQCEVVGSNTAFCVVLYRRPDVVDADTQTAIPSAPVTFLANLLKVQIPQHVCVADTQYRFKRGIIPALPRWGKVPYFALKDKCLYTLSDLADPQNTLRDYVELNTVSLVPADSLMDDPDRARLLVELLNGTLRLQLRQSGLQVVQDRSLMKCYFPVAPDGSQREVAYQGRLRKATRTVARPVFSRATNRLRFYEHQSAWCRIRIIGRTPVVEVTPSYVFTADGRNQLLTGPRVGPLTTVRLYRDFNPSVRQDIAFWAAVLEEATRLETGPYFGSLRISSELPRTVGFSSNEVAAESDEVSREFDWETLSDATTIEDDEDAESAEVKEL